MSDKEFEKAIAKARKRVREMDKIDGFMDRELTTIYSAFKAGIKRPETGAQFDGLVMLEDIIKSSTN